MGELRKPKDEEEADMLYSALSALANVHGPYVNFILRRQEPKFTWETDNLPEYNPQPYYTIKREPAGYWRTNDGRLWPVLQIKCGTKPVMLIAPELAQIVAKTPATPSDTPAPSPRPGSPSASDQP